MTTIANVTIDEVIENEAKKLATWVEEHIIQITAELMLVGFVNEEHLKKGAESLIKLGGEDLTVKVQGMLNVIEKALDIAEEHYGQREELGSGTFGILVHVSDIKMLLETALEDLRHGWDRNEDWYMSVLCGAVDSFTNEVWKQNSIRFIACVVKALEREGSNVRK